MNFAKNTARHYKITYM